ncbi:MAG TPA: hypothetical protein VHO06_19355, partial [Polyangia bacterium]|nr:hypothetical protein [Polyangia bacterium]
MRTALLVAAALWLAGGARAFAHQQTTTFGTISYPADGADGADLTWQLRIRSVDLARLLGDRAPRAAEILRGGLHVAAAAGGATRLCAPGAATLGPEPGAAEPTTVFVARFACGAGARVLHLRYDLFFDHDPYH